MSVNLYFYPSTLLTRSRSLKETSSPCSASVALSTPTLSFSDSFYDINDTIRSLPLPLQRNFSSDSRSSKRLHLAPRPRLSRYFSAPSSDLASLSSVTSPINTIQACHICSRRPSTVQDLPAYNDCETCNKRTCFVCTRTCEGPHCQSTEHITLGFPGVYLAAKRVCSRCCVEVGSEGTIWCNICYDDDTELTAFHKGNKEQLQIESEGRVAQWLSHFEGPDDMDLRLDSAVLHQQQFIGF